jgi:hypothetical protein
VGLASASEIRARVPAGTLGTTVSASRRRDAARSRRHRARLTSIRSTAVRRLDVVAYDRTATRRPSTLEVTRPRQRASTAGHVARSTIRRGRDVDQRADQLTVAIAARSRTTRA